MLTRKQFELLRFIHERLKESGVPPSFDEMKDALDLRSKSGIHRLITALEERGFIRRLPNRARAIEVIKLPDQSRPGRRPARFHAERHRGHARPGAHRLRGGQRPAGRHSDDGPDRRRHADRGDPDQDPDHQHAARHARQRRSFRARGARRLDDRGRHPRRRHRADQEDRGRRHRRHRGGADRRGGSDARSASAAAAPRSRSSPPTPPTRSGSCRRRGCASRARWWDCSADTSFVSRTRCSAKRCTADPGHYKTPNLERSRVCKAALRAALRPGTAAHCPASNPRADRHGLHRRLRPSCGTMMFAGV